MERLPDCILFFEVHQPYRLDRRFKAKLIKHSAARGRVRIRDLETLYLDQDLNRRVIRRVAERCYIPATSLFLELLDEYANFRVSYSFSGILLEQVERWAPDALELFRQVAKHPRAEVVGQTYYHSLACLISEEEFRSQVSEHKQLLKTLLGYKPTIFENTEFIYDNHVAVLIQDMGFKAVFTEGAERVLGWRSPNYVYRAKGLNLKVLLRNYRLSDDVAFRFSSRWWKEYPLTADKYASWLAASPGQVVCICIDYETIGEHYPEETGIFEFFKHLPSEALKWENLRFATPSEAIERHQPVDELDVPPSQTVSWADPERDLSAWLQNDMQKIVFNEVIQLEPLVKGLRDPLLTRLWRLMTISDHYYYMTTKGGGPGMVHTYFSPFRSAAEAFITTCIVVTDLELRVYERYRGAGRLALLWLRKLSKDEAFTFRTGEGVPLPLEARSGLEFISAIRKAPVASLEYHVSRGDFAKWLREVLEDYDAAVAVEGLKELRGEALRAKLLEILENRVNTAMRTLQLANS